MDVKEILNEGLKKLAFIREIFVGSSLSNLATPTLDNIDALGRVAKDHPRYRSFLCKLEDETNKNIGHVSAIGEPLYPIWDFFNLQAEKYMIETPSALGKGREQITQILSSSGALKPPQRTGNVTDLGDTEPLEANVKDDTEY